MVDALVLASPALGQEPAASQERPNQNEEEREPDKAQPAEESAVVPPGLPPLVGAEPTSKPHNQDSKARKNAQPEKPPGVAANSGIWGVWGDTPAQWIMAVFGTVATGISVWAVLLLRSTLKATREAVGEARAGTRTAEKAVEVTSETAKHQLRAYLLTDDVAIDEGPAGKNIKAIFLNSGQTPAKSIKGYMGFVADEGDEQQFIVDEATLRETRDVGPGQPLKMVKNVAEANLSQQTWQDIEFGGTPFFVHGRIQYTDVFGESHSTIFRFKFSARDKTFYVADKGNQAD